MDWTAAQILSDGTLPESVITNAQHIAVFGSTQGTDGDGEPLAPIVPDLGVEDVEVPAPTTAAPGKYYVTVRINYQYSPVFNFLMPSPVPTFHPKETMIFVGYVVPI